MSTSHKEKIIRVLQLFQTTDEKTPMNAVQISQKLEEEYGMENVHRTSIYDDVRLLQSCGYPIKQAENSHKGWYMEKHLLEDWEIKLMLDSVQQARCVSVHEANEIRNKISKEFYYLGRVIATGNAKQFVMPNTDKTAVEIEWELETPVREDIYQYIVNE